jgi:hypothetical protein
MAEQQVEHLWTVVPRCQEGCRISIYIKLADIGSRASEEQGIQDPVGEFAVEPARSGEHRKVSVVIDGLGDDEDNLRWEIHERHFDG